MLYVVIFPSGRKWRIYILSVKDQIENARNASVEKAAAPRWKL